MMSIRGAVTLATMFLGGTSALAGGIDEYVSLTYNLQGSNMADKGGSKWTSVVQQLVGSYEVMAIQEAGPEPDKFQNRRSVKKENCKDGANNDVEYEVVEYTWQIGSKSRGWPAYVYFVEVHLNRVNIALVSQYQSAKAHIICPQPDNTSNNNLGTRPVFGIEMPNKAVFLTTHAGSYGNNTYNDADNLVAAVHKEFPVKGQVSWALLADFNREPNQLNKLPASTRTVSSGAATTQGSKKSKPRELDYMVVRVTSNLSKNLQACIPGGYDSDHFPVAFAVQKPTSCSSKKQKTK